MLTITQQTINKLLWDRSNARYKSKEYLMQRLESQAEIRAQTDELIDSLINEAGMNSPDIQ